MTKEALKLALEALEGWNYLLDPKPDEKTITAIKEALAQPAQEPVAWIEKDMQCDDFDPDSVTCEKPARAADGWEWIPLYTTPPQRPWVGLTDEEVKHEWEVWRASLPRYSGFAKGIEAKLKKKNT